MTEAEWLAGTDPQKKVSYLQGRACDRKLRLLVVACCRLVLHWIKDERDRTAVELGELYADGLIEDKDLRDAPRAGWNWPYETVFDKLAASAATMAQALWSARRSETRTDGLRVSGLQTSLTEVAFGNLIWIGSRDNPLGRVDPNQEREIVQRGVALVDDLFGNPFRPVTADPRWLTSTAVALARTIYEERAFDRLPILADALEESGCDEPSLLGHCRSDGHHVRGCWAVDLVLGKE